MTQSESLRFKLLTSCCVNRQTLCRLHLPCRFTLNLVLSPTGSDEDEQGPAVSHMPNGKTDNEDGEIHIKRLTPDVIPVQATEHMIEDTPPYMNGDLSEGESPAETDSSEDMNMAPHGIPPPPPLSKYTNREDMVRVTLELLEY